jgi:hypothetical protein
MPALADITVKKNDGTTDITFTGVAPSSGDSSPAVWKSQSVGSAASHQPELRLTSREANNGGKRALRATFVYPQIATNSTTGITSVVNRAMASVDITIPKEMAATDVNEFVSQFSNLVDSTLIVSCMKAGYSAS